MAAAAFLEYTPSTFERLPDFYEVKSKSVTLRPHLDAAGGIIKVRRRSLTESSLVPAAWS